MEQKYADITELLLRIQGVDVSIYDDFFLDKALQKRISETGSGTIEDYFTFVERDNREGEIFLNSLNISYSEFFRNPLTFAVLERIILPSIAAKKGDAKRKEIRIWTAACAAGQETYSLAILLEELQNKDQGKSFFRIFASDQCESQLTAARKGQYSVTDLKNLNLKRFNQWFIQNGDTCFVKEELKKNIDFSTFDLLNEQLGCPAESIFGDFDLVICANLLFYYKPEYQKKILEKTSKCLVNGGYLITGETEREILIKQNYHEVFPQSAIFQRR